MPKGQMRSVDARRFSMVPQSNVPRSAFDISHYHKTTFSAGYLVPVYVDEVLPGDTLRLRMHAFARLSTPLVPVMDNLTLETFFFFVPCRLLWSNWERFMGEMASPSDTTEFLLPQVVIAQADMAPALLPDYMGITINAASTLSVNALPFRAYNLVYNEFFRDQDIQSKRPENMGDGPDAIADYLTPALRGKKHDYFTTARPWPFKPLPNSTVLNSFDPLAYQGTFQRPAAGAPVTGLGFNPANTPEGVSGTAKESGWRDVTYSDYFLSSNDPIRVRASPAGAGAAAYPDLRVLVNDLRIAATVQQYLELAARGGSRYTEIVRSLFGVVSPDARLQRPEYLGGGRSFVTVNAVAQTSASGVAGTTTELGEQAGVGSVGAYNHGFSQSFTEHGYIIGLANIRSELTYQQGVSRLWNRRTMFDFYSPPFAHLGEQAIQGKELYATGTAATDNAVFGYQERWAEYKYKASRTSGYFRSTVATPLDMWHLGQKFTAQPALNTAFIEDVPPISRVLQVSQNYGQAFLMDALFEARWVRCMPMFSIPGVGPRF